MLITNFIIAIVSLLICGIWDFPWTCLNLVNILCWLGKAWKWNGLEIHRNGMEMAWHDMTMGWRGKEITW
jgi:hypothetical protein